MRKILLILTSQLLSVLVSSGQDNARVLKLSLSGAKEYAVENNRAVQSSKLDILLANKKIWENLAQGFPQFNITANYLHQFVVPEISLGPYLDQNALPDGPLTKQDFINAYKDSPPFKLGVMDNATIDFTLSQLIFNGQYITGLHATKIVKQLSEKALEKISDQTKESVAGTYYLILVLRENLKLLKESEESLGRMYDEMKKMNEQGLNEETDADQVNVSRSNIITMMTSIGLGEETSMKLLKYQLGVGFETPVELTDSLPGIIAEANLRYLAPQQFILNNSIDYQMAGLQEKISGILLNLEKSKYLPSVSAFYRHEEQTNQPAFNFAVKDLIGATLTLPIFSSGMQSSRVSQAKYNLQKADLTRADAEQGLTMEFETARNTYQTAYSNFTTNRESMLLSKKIYDRTVIKYHEGVSSSFELAQNQNQFLTAETNYYNSMLSLLSAKAKLDRILRIE